MINFKTIIGLEVHVELNTASKMFCSCSAKYFGSQPNTNTCPVCLGLPGALPVPNKQAIDWTILLGLVLNCDIPETSKFDRKNYFYPDLPKGYQISQYDKPLAVDGFLEIATASGLAMTNKLRNDKIIRIKRVHLEEDTGKLMHEGDSTLIDFNRSGVPLVEIVTEPDFTSTEEVTEYLQKLQQIIRYLGISDADMDKGQMRCEPTINLELDPSRLGQAEADMGTGNQHKYTPLVEIKNINSFKFVQKAIDYEVKRQVEEFEKTRIEKQAGNKTTRGWNEKTQETFLQRTKEEAEDYRYFPEPDIPPFHWTETEIRNSKFEIRKIELPEAKIRRYVKDFGLLESTATILTDTKEKAEYFEKCVEQGKDDKLEPKVIANWIVNKRGGMDDLIMKEGNKTAYSHEQLETIIQKIIVNNPNPVIEYKNGKVTVLEFLVGLTARETKGQADPNLSRKILLDMLKN